MDADGAVVGVAELDGVIYAVTDGASGLLAFRTPLYGRLNDIVVKEMKNPRDMAACLTTKHLYVADWGEKCIWRLKVDVKSKIEEDDDPQNGDQNQNCSDPKYDKYPQQNDDRQNGANWYVEVITVCKWAKEDSIRSLSVTSSGQVLVIANGKFVVYTSDGNISHVILMKEKGFDLPHHVIEMTSNDTKPSYIFCLGSKDSPLHRVSEISLDGDILTECSFGLLSRPVHLADGEDGSIFVADDRHIFLMNHRLQIERIVISQSPGDEPFYWMPRLCYTRESNRLVVCWGGRYIHVYGTQMPVSSSSQFEEK